MSQIHPVARLELEDATLYYAGMSNELAEKFLNDLSKHSHMLKLCL